jgi:hypothetical protein
MVAERPISMETLETNERGFGLINPGLLVRLEGLVGLIVAILLYGELDRSWWLLVVLFLAPDLSMIGYAAGNRIGAAAYNAVHTIVGPLILAAIGVLGDRELATAIALIWLAHIAMDRAIGYGLKLPTGFKDTHLG